MPQNLPFTVLLGCSFVFFVMTCHHPLPFYYEPYLYLKVLLLT
ncbi:hypothetical protein BMG_3267 [Priestia megaterium]|nr:hypothetical protein BMG_3267 [Priestia megaterium]